MSPFPNRVQQEILQMTGCAPATQGCHDSHEMRRFFEKETFKLVEKVSSVALCLFAAYVSWKRTAAAFILGFAWALLDPKLKSDPLVDFSPLICGQGLLRQIAGAEVPYEVAFAADLAVKWSHIDHCGPYSFIAGLGGGVALGLAARDYRASSPANRA